MGDISAVQERLAVILSFKSNWFLKFLRNKDVQLTFNNKMTGRDMAPFYVFSFKSVASLQESGIISCPLSTGNTRTAEPREAEANGQKKKERERIQQVKENTGK